MGVWQGVCVENVLIFIQMCANVLCVAQLSPRDKPEGPDLLDCMKICYLFRLDVYYLVTDKYKTVYLECSCELEHSPR